MVSSSDLYPLVCLKNGFKNICLKPKIDRTCASSLWKTDTIVFVELNKPPSPLSPPPPSPNVFEINKPPWELNREFTVLLSCLNKVINPPI